MEDQDLSELAERLAKELPAATARDKLLGLLTHPTDDLVRSCAAEALSRVVGESLVVDALLRALSTERDPTARACIVESLGNSRDPALAGKLAAHLVDEDAVVRMHICRAVGVLGDAQLIQQLQDIAIGDPAFPVRVAANVALLRLGEESAEAWLGDLMRQPPTPREFGIALNLLEDGLLDEPRIKLERTRVHELLAGCPDPIYHQQIERIEETLAACGASEEH